MKKQFYFLLAFCLLFSARSFATTFTVSVANFQFSPTSVTAHVGDTIKWVWSNGSHTTTSTTVPAGAASWNSVIDNSTTTFSYKVTAPGTYNYVCTPHAPNMAGTITVLAATTVSNVRGQNALALYPNPTANAINLDLSRMRGAVSITITDASGRIVRTITAEGGKAQSVAATELAAGMYLLRATAGDVSEAVSFSVVR